MVPLEGLLSCYLLETSVSPVTDPPSLPSRKVLLPPRTRCVLPPSCPSGSDSLLSRSSRTFSSPLPVRCRPNSPVPPPTHTVPPTAPTTLHPFLSSLPWTKRKVLLLRRTTPPLPRPSQTASVHPSRGRSNQLRVLVLPLKHWTRSLYFSCSGHQTGPRAPAHPPPPLPSGSLPWVRRHNVSTSTGAVLPCRPPPVQNLPPVDVSRNRHDSDSTTTRYVPFVCPYPTDTVVTPLTRSLTGLTCEVSLFFETIVTTVWSRGLSRTGAVCPRDHGNDSHQSSVVSVPTPTLGISSSPEGLRLSLPTDSHRLVSTPTGSPTRRHGHGPRKPFTSHRVPPGTGNDSPLDRPTWGILQWPPEPLSTVPLHRSTRCDPTSDVYRSRETSSRRIYLYRDRRNFRRETRREDAFTSSSVIECKSPTTDSSSSLPTERSHLVFINGSERIHGPLPLSKCRCLHSLVRPPSSETVSACPRSLRSRGRPTLCRVR